MRVLRHSSAITNVLLVQDNANNVRMVQAAFPNAKVSVVTSSREAVSFLTQQVTHADVARLDAVLIDFDLPRMQRHEVLRQIGDDDRLRGIPTIILITSESEVATMEHGQFLADYGFAVSARFGSLESLASSMKDIRLARVNFPNNTVLSHLTNASDLSAQDRALRSNEIFETWQKKTIETVLLVEDNAGDARLLLEMFNERGGPRAKIAVVQTVGDAEAHLAGHIPDVILLDLGLPDAQGLSAVRRIRAAAPFVALLVLTGFDDESMAAHALQEGAVDYLIKGEIESRGLLRSLRYAIERRSIEDALLNERANAQLARALAEDANRAKSQFLAGITHELRTPLHGILGYAQLLRLEAEMNARQLAMVDAMLSAGMHLLQMINSVLDLSEIEAGHVNLQEADLDLRELASACVGFVHPAAKAKNIALKLVMGPEMPFWFRADATRLRQVLLNLLGNAVKFTIQGSVELCVRLAADRASVLFEVVDTGPGISAEQRGSLFKDFERLRAYGSNIAEGAGLGLAIAARLAALMHGSLGYRDNPAGGSVFWLEMHSESKTSDVPHLATSPTPGLHGSASVPAAPRALRILVVDDIAMNRDIAGSFLRAAGHAVDFAEGGLEAVAAVAAEDFDVVLMDVRMPELDGLEATRRIRALDGLRSHVPIVALTAQAFSEQVRECLEAGMDGHVGKPFTPDTLLHAVLLSFEARPAPAATNDRAEPLQVNASETEGVRLIPPVDARPSPVGLPEAVPELPTLDQAVFQRTAAFLSSETVADYLRLIDERAEAVLRGLEGADLHIHTQDGFAESAHILAGSAGMFGFGQLAAVARHFERAIQTGAEDTPVLAQRLRTAIQATVEEIRILRSGLQGLPLVTG